MAKQILLTKLTLVNFKGLRNVTVHLKGGVTTISGRNGTGKTTIVDGYNWILWGKDSAGNSDTKFGIKTTDNNGEFIPHLEHEGTAEFQVIDTDTGEKEERVYRRVLKEDWKETADQYSGETTEHLKGHHTDYYFNDMPLKTKAEYDRLVAELLPENIFKVISSPRYFLRDLPWKTQREMLLNIAGDIDDKAILNSDERFAKLSELLTGKTLEGYKGQLRESRAKVEADLKAIPTRIDEVTRNTPANIDFAALAVRLSDLKKQYDEKDAAMTSAAEENRQAYEAKRDIQSRICDLKLKQQDIISQAEREAKKKASEANNGYYDLQNKLLQATANYNELKAKAAVQKAEKEASLSKTRREYEEANEGCRNEKLRVLQQRENDLLIKQKIIISNAKAEAESEAKKANEGRVNAKQEVEKWTARAEMAKHYHESDIEGYKGKIEQLTAETESLKTQQDDLRKQWYDENAKEFTTGVLTCPLYGRACKDQLAICQFEDDQEQAAQKFEARKQEKLERLTVEGKAMGERLAKLQDNIDLINAAIEKNNREYDQERAKYEADIAEFNSKLAGTQEVKPAEVVPEQLEDWKQACDDLKEVRADIEKVKAMDVCLYQSEEAAYKSMIDKLTAELKEADAATESELAKIEAERKSLQQQMATAKLVQPEEVHPEQLEDWKQAEEQIKSLQAQLSEGAETDNATVTRLRDEREALRVQIDGVKAELAKKEQVDACSIRIEELNEQKRKLQKQKTDLQLKESLINDFEKARMDEVENRVNKLFKIVSFKMFHRQIEDAKEVPDCVAYVEGTRYEDKNNAGQINAGLDVINALCNFYKVSAPVFIDNAESVNAFIPTCSQLIKLVVTNGDFTVTQK